MCCYYEYDYSTGQIPSVCVLSSSSSSSSSSSNNICKIYDEFFVCLVLPMIYAAAMCQSVHSLPSPHTHTRTHTYIYCYKCTRYVRDYILIGKTYFQSFLFHLEATTVPLVKYDRWLLLLLSYLIGYSFLLLFQQRHHQ